jgi:hypothetical protein
MTLFLFLSETRSGLEIVAALRAGRIFDTPPLKGLTFASERLQSLAY